jgi:hypothetical protein
MADKGKGSGLDRREFLRRAAVTTAAAAWAAPVIQTVSASPAFAQTNGTPQPNGCFHSIAEGKPNGCMETCKAQDDICGPPDGVCAAICNPACNLPENACPPEYCDPACWGCDTSAGGDPTNPVFIC